MEGADHTILMHLHTSITIPAIRPKNKQVRDTRRLMSDTISPNRAMKWRAEEREATRGTRGKRGRRHRCNIKHLLAFLVTSYDKRFSCFSYFLMSTCLVHPQTHQHTTKMRCYTSYTLFCTLSAQKPRSLVLRLCIKVVVEGSGYALEHGPI